MRPYFIFNNIKSTDYLLLNKLPSILKATKDIQKVEIEGRDGFLTQNLGSYRGDTKTIECTIRNLDDIDYICKWLDGSGELIFSNEPDKFYKATIITQIDFNKIIREYRKFIVKFECQPFGYSIYSTSLYPQIITKPTTIYNNFTYYSEPVIKIYGEGNITLNVGSQIVELTNVSQHVTINTPLMDCYKDTLLKNNDMNGGFPILKVGNNNISWTGNVIKIDIIQNFRSL